MYWTQKHVLVCTSSHCTQKGAMDVVGRLRLDIIRKGLDTQILVNNCGTIDLCDVGPNMVVYPDNIIYGGVTVKDLPEIVEYLKGGPVVERLLIGPGSPQEIARREFYASLVAMADVPELIGVEELASQRELGPQFIAEQLKRGFMAKKADEEGTERYSATKKAKARYGI